MSAPDPHRPDPPGLPVDDTPLAPSAGSRWGRRASRTYLAVVAFAAGAMVFELFAGRSGPGVFALSLLTAPWSVLLASLARSLYGHLGAGTLRALGLVLMALAALLNARIIHGIAARYERDARAARASEGLPPRA
jgi:hypothetical protein